MPGAVSNHWTFYDYFKVAVRGMPPSSFGGIDVTTRCNLQCKHCYFGKQTHTSELSTEEWLAKLEDLKSQGFPFLICGWIGGEPLLRKDLVERGKRYFKSNVIFTNGTIELPSWSDVRFSVSVHGTEEYYYKMTGAERGVYQRIKRNADRKDVGVVIAFCVTRLNHECIEAMLEEWVKTSVLGIVFEFYTPMKNEGDELWLNWQERDQVIDKIIALRKRYGRFIWITDRIYRLMKSDVSQRVTRNCPFPKIGFSFDSQGAPKIPCQLGSMADCSRCGCILPFYSAVLTDRRLLFPEFLVSASTRCAGSLRGIWNGAR
ncbi:MAG: radical SAM protein [Deltaproteobacteria bacterium]